MNHPDYTLSHQARSHQARYGTTIELAAAPAGEVVAVPVMALRRGESPRLNGEDKAHIARLVETEEPLPPILVDRNTMRVIDGMHRLMAASVQGSETIDVVFFDGSEDEVFLRAVQENVMHGLPLTQADRRVAAERIIASHPRMSDRAIGRATGLAAKTVAIIRKRSTGELPQSNARVGRDGRVRPLDSSQARRRAAKLLIDQPQAPLRDIAQAAGIAPSTVLDVRKRLERGEPPVPSRPASNANGSSANGTRGHADDGSSLEGTALKQGVRSIPAPDPTSTVAKLLRDPSLRNNERGKGMLRLLHMNAVGVEQLPDVAETVPAHCVGIVGQLARQYSKMWLDFARELDGRAHIINPSA